MAAGGTQEATHHPYPTPQPPHTYESTKWTKWAKKKKKTHKAGQGSGGGNDMNCKGVDACRKFSNNKIRRENTKSS